jgi:hypothetical protein
MAARRTEESLAESRKAFDVNPNFHLAWHYQMSRQADATIERQILLLRWKSGIALLSRADPKPVIVIAAEIREVALADQG